MNKNKSRHSSALVFAERSRAGFLAGAAFEDGDDGVEGEADGAESGENAGGHEILVGEPGGLEKERGEEKAREGGDDGDDGESGWPAGNRCARFWQAG